MSGKASGYLSISLSLATGLPTFSLPIAAH
mgnify:CR=1 FL=1